MIKYVIQLLLVVFGYTTPVQQKFPAEPKPQVVTFHGYSGDTASAINGLRAELREILPDTKYRRMTPAAKIVFYEPDNSLHPIYAVNPSMPVTPASVEKMFTTSAILWALGSEYKFTTKLDILPPARTEGNMVIGSIYLRPSGDPTLRAQDFDELASQLSSKGIRQIEGDIISDQSDDHNLSADAKEYFAGQNVPQTGGDSVVHETAGLDSTSDSDAADETNDELSDEITEPGFLSSSPNFFIDRNVISVRVSGGDRKGSGAHVSISPPLANVKLIAHAGTSAPARVSRRRVRIGRGRHAKYRNVRVRSRSAFTVHVNSTGEANDPTQTITVTGLIPAHSTHVYTIPIRNVPLSMAALLKWKLEQNGIRVLGSARTGKPPDKNAQAITLAKKETPLIDLLQQTNKRSDNFLAECMFRKLSSLSDVSASGSAERSRKVIKSWLSVIHCYNNMCYDGSGLSRSNETTANTVIDLLHGIRQRPTMYNDFISTLSVAGVDGTTRGRMINTPAENNARSKTGTLNGVTALAGYVVTRDGQLASYFITMQDYGRGVRNYRAIQDRVVEKLAGFSYGDYLAKYNPGKTPPSATVTAPQEK